MESNNANIRELRAKLDDLINRQNRLRAYVDGLRGEIADLQTNIRNLAETPPPVIEEPKPIVEAPKPIVETPEAPIIEEKTPEIVEEKLPPIITPAPAPISTLAPAPIQEKPPVPKPAPIQERAPITPQNQVVPQNEKSSIESFLGENLANKIGIAIILIGIGVGVKYAIDKNILGPGMRIALGYLAGAILIGFALYLKKKYENLSAVMFAGGMAVAYFVTFIAYDFYDLFPKMAAFGSMLVLTVITSLGAIRYDKQIIAIVGLVGAYAVPFLLSDGTGTTFALFLYMSIINAGILFLAFRKNWQPVFGVTFGCTWFIFLVLCLRAVWSLPSDYMTLFIFGTVFYVLFHAMLIANKTKYKAQIEGGEMSVIVLNTIFAYSFGIILINLLYDNSIINGVYTILFAASQGLVALIAKNQKETDHRLYYLSFGFALIFITLSVPMMFDGHWITIFWSLQALLFFWIGWKKDDPLLEKISYIPVILALGSLLDLWIKMSSTINTRFAEPISPIFNEYFLAGVVLASALFGMTLIRTNSEKPSTLSASQPFFELLSKSLVYAGIAMLYFSTLMEIDIFWDQRSSVEEIETSWFSNYYSSTDTLKTIWMIIFSLFFVGFFQLANRYFVKNKTLSTALAVASTIAAFVFLFIGLYNMSVLRDRSLEGVYGNALEQYPMTYSIRYIGYAGLAFVLFTNSLTLRYFFKDRSMRQTVEIFIHICLVWVVCSELIHLKQMNGGGDLYRAGLTIFGGIYAFGLIAFGIWKKKPHLRLLALVLFGVTLLKLFIYDISKVDSGGKTIAFISLGVLLLVISFLYTKYKHLILTSEEEKNQEEESNSI